MIATEQLIEAFRRNVRIVKMQTDRLTHADSLLQPSMRGNCMNWVLGHVMASRNTILSMLDQETDVATEDLIRYQGDNDPITEDGDGVLKLEDLLDALERSQQKIDKALESATSDVFDRQIKRGDKSVSVGERIFFLYFHETYHTGQTELLRQLAGTDDKVI